jgi:hypothetical protein
MPGHGEKLTRRQEAAIVALLTTGTVEAAAKKAGLAYSTLRAWLQRPDFREAYREARRRLLDDAVLVLQKLATSAVLSLGEQLKADKPTVCIQAATVILDRAFRGTELCDLIAEVENLKRAVEEMKRERSGPYPRRAATPG